MGVVANGTSGACVLYSTCLSLFGFSGTKIVSTLHCWHGSSIIQSLLCRTQFREIAM